LERPIYVRNIDSIFNYEGQIEYTAKVRLFYKRHKRMEINVIEGKKWSVILEMLWLVHHNPKKIDWRIEKIKIIKCPEECEKK